MIKYSLSEAKQDLKFKKEPMGKYTVRNIRNLIRTLKVGSYGDIKHTVHWFVLTVFLFGYGKKGKIFKLRLSTTCLLMAKYLLSFITLSTYMEATFSLDYFKQNTSMFNEYLIYKNAVKTLSKSIILFF